MRIISVLFALVLFSCSEKEELNPEFRKIIIDYQKTYPVKNPVQGNKYIYVATFYGQNDTAFIIYRTNKGILNTNNIYGLYSDKELRNFIVYDKSKLSVKQIKVYKKEFPDSVFFKGNPIDVDITPRVTYKLKRGIPKYIRTDTILNSWN